MGDKVGLLGRQGHGFGMAGKDVWDVRACIWDVRGVHLGCQGRAFGMSGRGFWVVGASFWNVWGVLLGFPRCVFGVSVLRMWASRAVCRHSLSLLS